MMCELGGVCGGRHGGACRARAQSSFVCSSHPRSSRENCMVRCFLWVVVSDTWVSHRAVSSTIQRDTCGAEPSDRAAARRPRLIIWTTAALHRHIIVYGSRAHPTRTLEQPSVSQASCVRHQRRQRVLLPLCCSRLRLRAFLCTFQQSGMPREERRALGRLARRSTTSCGD